MANIVEIASQQSSKDRASTEYLVTNVSELTVAYALAKAYSPVVFANLFKQDVHVQEIGRYTWKATARYGINEPGDVGDSTWSFEIGTQSQKITHALEHIASYNAAGVIGDEQFAGAMNVTGEGNEQKTEGADLLFPVFTWEETHYIAWDVFTIAYVDTLRKAVAHTNDDVWRVWSEQELILLGVSGSKAAQVPVALTFRFGSSQTETDKVVENGDTDITVATKMGQHYSWVEYWKEKEGNNLTTRAKAVHVERVYDTTAFADLGLPDPWE